MPIFDMTAQIDGARRGLMLFVIGFAVAVSLFGSGVLLGWYLHTPKVTQKDLNKEAEIAGEYEAKRGGDKAKADQQKGKAAAASTKVIYRNCSLEPDDLQNLMDAFTRGGK